MTATPSQVSTINNAGFLPAWTNSPLLSNLCRRWIVRPLSDANLAIKNACNPVSIMSTGIGIFSSAVRAASYSPISNAASCAIMGFSIPPIIYSFCKQLNPNRVDRLMLILSSGAAAASAFYQLCSTDPSVQIASSNLILTALGVTLSVLANHIYKQGITRLEKNRDKIFLIIFGPPAAGKMTVGQEVSKRTNLKLFHNHLVIEPLLTIFDFKDPSFRKLVHAIRSQIFEEVALNSMRGIIFTFVWNFNNSQSRDSVDSWSEFFKKRGSKIYVVELICDLEVRLERNQTENRLQNKVSKRDLEKSKEIMLDNEKNWKMQSGEDFHYGDKFLRIDNRNMTASQVAERIIDFFNLGHQS